MFLKIILKLWFDFDFVLQAYVYTKASKIIGVEMNADLCNIQNKLIKKYNFQVSLRFVGHCSDMYSDILSHKLAPFSVFFLYWKNTDYDSTLYRVIILCGKYYLSFPLIRWSNWQQMTWYLLDKIRILYNLVVKWANIHRMWVVSQV